MTINSSRTVGAKLHSHPSCIRLFCIGIFVLVILSQTAIAQSGTPECDQIVDNFFSLVKGGSYGEAIEFLYPLDNKWNKLITDDVQKIKSQFMGLPTSWGSCIDHSLLVERMIEGKFLHRDYFVAFERGPIRFKFQFYKVKEKWKVHAFAYNNDIEDWISDAAKFSIQFEKQK